MLEELHPTARRHLKRNFRLGVVNGAMFSLSDALQDPTLVLSVFIDRLSGSGLLVGLLVPVRMGGWFLPQLLLSGRVQASARKMPYYRMGALVRVVVNFGLAIAALTLRDYGLLLALAFLFMTTNTLSGGLTGLAFTDVVGKVIPSRRRGSFMAWRMFIGGILVLLGSFLVRYFLDESHGPAFPRNYGVLFLISAFCLTASLGSFTFIREPKETNVRPRAAVGEQLRRAGTLPRHNDNYRYFLVARVALMLAEVASPFYIIYARTTANLPSSVIGYYLMVSTIANILSTYIWGQVSDRMSNRALLRIVSLVGGCVPALALLSGPLLDGGGIASGLSVIYFGAVFAFLGAARTGIFMGSTNFLLDVVPANDRPIYIGLANTLVGIASLTTILGGALVEVAGYEVLFALTTLLFLVAWLAISRASDPRSGRA